MCVPHGFYGEPEVSYCSFTHGFWLIFGFLRSGEMDFPFRVKELQAPGVSMREWAEFPRLFLHPQVDKGKILGGYFE